MGEGASGKSATAPSRVACLPEYFMYYNYLKRLGTRQHYAHNYIYSDKKLYFTICVLSQTFKALSGLAPCYYKYFIYQ
jgi:hypothetical protein